MANSEFNLLHANARFHLGHMPDAARLNQAILQKYLALQAQDFSKRSHYFDGRYENLYLDRELIPGLGQIIDQAEMFAAALLNMPKAAIKSGFWINDMGPGQATTRHDHVDYDELLSGVYYVRVPDESGNLIMHESHSETVIYPQEGMFVFFAPDVEHSVSVNHSRERRISIGMNFGPGQNRARNRT